MDAKTLWQSYASLAADDQQLVLDFIVFLRARVTSIPVGPPSGGSIGEDPFFACELVGTFEGFLVGDGHDRVEKITTEQRRNEAGTDALDGVGARDSTGQDR